MSAALRAGRDDDAAGIIALVGACWAEYPGCVMDLDGECPEFRALATYAAGRGGALWIAEEKGCVVGMVMVRPHEGEAWELGKLYVAAGQRGTGVAHRLVDAAEGHARAHGARRVVLWSDTRFDRAHRFYEKRSYVRSGPIRVLGDKSNSIEFAYAKPLAGAAVERLDAAGAASAERRLAEILIACVDAGAAVSYMPPLSLDVARRHWRGVASEVAAGRALLLAAWLDGQLVGTVEVDLATPPNQPHRGEVRKLLVLPGARQRGLGRRLMQRVELEATAAGRRLLTLDTRAGDAGEALYHALGWQEAGRIPGYALAADGTPCDTVFFWKSLPA